MDIAVDNKTKVLWMKIIPYRFQTTWLCGQVGQCNHHHVPPSLYCRNSSKDASHLVPCFSFDYFAFEAFFSVFRIGCASATWKKDGRLTQQSCWPGEWLFMDKGNVIFGMQAPPKRQLSLYPLSGRKWAICRLGSARHQPAPVPPCFKECKHLQKDSCHFTHFLAGNELSVVWQQCKTPTSTSTTLLQRMQAPPKRQLSLNPLSGRKWAICRLAAQDTNQHLYHLASKNASTSETTVVT